MINWVFMVYLASSPVSPDNDVCIANVKLRKERRGFVCHHYVMVLLVRGHGKYIEEDTGREYKLEQGDVYQRFPGRSHAQVLDTDNNEQFFVKVPEMLYWLMQERGEIRPNPVLKIKDGIPFKEFKMCLLECQEKDDPAFSLWRVRELISKLHSMADHIEAEVDEIDKAQRILQSNLSTRLSLPDLAAELNMSYINFRRRFKSKTGMSPGAWQIKMRMDRACELLRSSEFSIAEISECLGYPDIYTFSKQFKKERGISPSMFNSEEFTND